MKRPQSQKKSNASRKAQQVQELRRSSAAGPHKSYDKYAPEIEDFDLAETRDWFWEDRDLDFLDDED